MKLAVTGATGQLGQHVLRQLGAAARTDVVALARKPEAVSGVAARRFDYNMPETLVPALEGVDSLLLISSSEIGARARQHSAVIAAAKEAGVGHIVYTSVLKAPTSPLFLAPEHVETETALAASGLGHTILRNGWYTENYNAAIAPALEHGALTGASGDGVVSGAGRADYAAAAVAVLTDPQKQGKTYELAGQPGFTMTQYAAELSAQSGKTIPFVNLPEADYAKILQGAGLPEPMAAAFAGADTAIGQGAVESDSTELETLIGRPTTPLAEVIRAALG